MFRRFPVVAAALAAGLALLAPQKSFAADTDAAVLRRAALAGTRGTYCHAPRKANGRVDVERLVAELVQINANTYSFCIHAQSTDWDDLRLLLPVAMARGIRVWASVVPPSESPPKAKTYAEPFRLDYIRWAEEFARLSLKYPVLVAWSIDDFTRNLKDTYTPEYVERMVKAARDINPRLAFIPCCYYRNLTPEFAGRYGALLDGVLFPYRAESAGANLKDPSLVQKEVATLRGILGAPVPIIVDIYATAHSRLGSTTPEYVDLAMVGAHASADGVMIYCHQDPVTDAAKAKLIEQRFTAWTSEPKQKR